MANSSSRIFNLLSNGSLNFTRTPEPCLLYTVKRRSFHLPSFVTRKNFHSREPLNPPVFHCRVNFLFRRSIRACNVPLTISYTTMPRKLNPNSRILIISYHLSRYERSGCLTPDRKRGGPPRPGTLYVTGRRSENWRHPRWDGHSYGHRAHRVHHSGIRQRGRRMSMMDRRGWPSRTRWTRGTVRRRGSVMGWHVRSGRPATPWPAFSMGFRRRLRHLWLFRRFTRHSSIS